MVVARNEAAAIKMQSAFVAELPPDSGLQISFINVESLLTDNLSHEFAVLVNTTSIGVSDMLVPDWYEALIAAVARQQQRSFFYDMVYARGNSPTLLQGVASRVGLPNSDGLQMLIGQALLAFQFWTGLEISANVMSSGLQAEQSTGC